MKFLRATASYLFAHLPKLLLLSAVPAAVFAFLLRPDGCGLVFVPASLRGDMPFSEVFFLVFGRDVMTKYPYIIPVGVLLLQVSISYTMGVVEKHFRVGKLSLGHPMRNINNCFAPVFKVSAVVLLLYLLFKLLLTCLLTFVSFVMGYVRCSSVAVSAAMSSVAVCAAALFLVAVRPIMFTAATMLVYGYSFIDAFGVTFKRGSQAWAELVLALMVPFALYVSVSALLVLAGAGYVISSLVMTVANAAIIQYVVVYVLVAMFEQSGIERRDKKTYY